MTVTLRHPHTDNHHNTFRNIVVALIAAAVVVFAVRSVTNTQTTATTTVADQTRPAIVDPTGLGAALSVTYDSSSLDG